jgi:dTDP-glucose 4,6-dehydratase
MGSKVVFCSSGAVYGQQPNHQNFLSEDDLLAPINSLSVFKRDYAAAKRDAEFEFNKLAQQGLNVAIARCFAFIGFYLPRDQHFAIGNFLSDAIKGLPISISATHKVFRSYMYADDLVAWLMSIADSGSASCPVFNVGSDQEIELGQLCKKVAKIIGGTYRDREIKQELIDRYIPSIDKAKNMLGLKLKYDLDASLIMMKHQLMRYH